MMLGFPQNIGCHRVMTAGTGKTLRPFLRDLAFLGVFGVSLLPAFSPALAWEDELNDVQVEKPTSATASFESKTQSPQLFFGYGDAVRSRRTVVTVASYDASNPFNALVGLKRKRNKNKLRNLKRVRLYVLSDGEKSFLFHDTGSQARIQFLCGDADQRIECDLDEDGKSSEVYTLAATRAPRGDVIYKDSEGHTLLRIASYGGATVWWPGDIEARAASRSFSDLTEINLKVVNGRKALRRANRATALLSALTGKPIEFRTPLDGLVFPPTELDQNGTRLSGSQDAGAEARLENNYESLEPLEQVFARSPGLRESSVLADAILMTTRLLLVEFVRASNPSMSLENGHLKIGYNVAEGLQGRPSSAQIARFLEENL